MKAGAPLLCFNKYGVFFLCAEDRTQPYGASFTAVHTSMMCKVATSRSMLRKLGMAFPRIHHMQVTTALWCRHPG